MIGLLLILLLTADSGLTLMIDRRIQNTQRNAAIPEAEKSDPLITFQDEREQLRANWEAQLCDIIHREGGDDEIADEASRLLTDMLRRAEDEAVIEGVLRSRGFEEAVASVGRDSACVLLRREGLTAREASVILELVMHQTGLGGEKVKIIPVK